MKVLLAFTLVVALGSSARADELILRGNYWRDRNTRILQPEADLSKEFPTGTTVGAHYLLDAITSASVAAGVTSDQPFTELRNELGVSVAQRVKSAQLGANYTYSSESDYWANLLAVSGTIDLFQRNTTLALALAWGHDNVGQRMGPTSFQKLGTLDSLRIIAGWTQVLSPTLLANLSWDIGVIGFGSKDNGFQANPYRNALLGGSPNRESLPFQRVRMAWALALHWMVPLSSKIMPYLAFRPAYRIYFDDWGIVSHTPELRTYIPIGPVELRLTGRYYTQLSASFWREQFGMPIYVNTAAEPNGASGARCDTCFLASSRAKTALFYTADPKLSDFKDMLLELRLLVRLRFMRRLSRFISEGNVELMYGHLFEAGYTKTAFGDAELAGIQLTFPL